MQYTNNIGSVIKKTVYGSQTPQQVIRVDRGKALARSALSMQQHMSKLNNIANVASKGSIVLAGVGLAANCSQIANTNDRLKKNEIAVETITSTGVGASLGFAAGIFLLSNPVGWGVVLAIGSASAIASIGAGQGMAYLYKTTDLKEVDLVNGLGIGQVCK